MRLYKKASVCLFFLIVFPFCIFSKNIDEQAEKILSKMSLDEKIGQLFLIPACPRRQNDNHLKDLEDIFYKYSIGGIIVKQSNPKEQIDFLNNLQKMSKYPLLVSADAEWGLAMRMDDVIAFPKNMTLAACQDDDLIYEMAKVIAKQLKAVGVHINFAPVVDINLNFSNPTINVRAFSDDKYLVTKKASKIVKGFQDENVIACLKHFPGYGDVFVDPHLDLPKSNHDFKRLYSQEFYPYKKLINQGVQAIMTAHIIIPNISDIPATMSKQAIDILKGFGFDNLIITDALNMKALSNYYSVEEIALKAHIAGNDFLLYGDHISPNIDDILKHQIPRAFEAIKKAYLDKKLDIENLDRHVLKILKAKFKLKLFEDRYIKPFNYLDFHKSDFYELKKNLFYKALTIVNKENILPLNIDENTTYISTKKDFMKDFLFEKFLNKKGINFQNISDFIDNDNKKILVIYASDLTSDIINKIKKLDKKNTLIVFFGSVYLMRDFLEFKNILLAYEEDEMAYQAAYKYLTGDIPAIGKLPIELK